MVGSGARDELEALEYGHAYGYDLAIAIAGGCNKASQVLYEPKAMCEGKLMVSHLLKLVQYLTRLHGPQHTRSQNRAVHVTV